jgi:SAM-dependent methyltransferase
MNEKLADEDSKYNEGTDWEERYLSGNAGWDQGAPVPALKESLEFFAEPKRILVPGCGLGHDAAGLADAGHEVEGWDIAPTALAGAELQYPNARLSFLSRDLLLGPLEFGSFDGIFEHTFLCAIGPERWKLAVKRYTELLRPRGLLFAVLFTSMEENNPPPWGISEKQVRDLFAPGFEILDMHPPKEAFPHRAGEETVWKMRRRY